MYVYLVKMQFNDVDYFKVGITRDPTRGGRFRKFIPYNYKVVKLWEADEDVAKYIEASVKQIFKCHSIKFPVDIYGKTEFFHSYDGIVEKISEILSLEYRFIESSLVRGGLNTQFRIPVKNMINELQVKRKDIDWYKIVINFYIINMVRLKHFNATHIRVGIASEAKNTDQTISMVKFIKITEHLVDFDYLVMVKGFGKNKTTVQFTDKFQNTFACVKDIHKCVNKRNLET